MNILLLRVMFLLSFMGGISITSFAQEGNRMEELGLLLDSLAKEIPALEEETNVSFSNLPLSSYVRAIGLEHQINVYIQDTPNMLITSNLSKEAVKHVFLFICKHFHYQLELVGSIIEFRPYVPAAEAPPPAPSYKPDIQFEDGLLSVDLKSDSLYQVVKSISQLSGVKILVPTGVNGKLTAYLPPTPLDTALEALFRTNGYIIRKRKKGYLVLTPNASAISENPSVSGNNFSIQTYTDGEDDYLSIEAKEADLALLLEELFERLGTHYVLYDALDGRVTAYAAFSTLDEWLDYVLQGTEYSYKKEGELYLIGKASHPWLQQLEIIKLKHRPTRQVMELIPGLSDMVRSPSSQPVPAHARPSQQAMAPSVPFSQNRNSPYPSELTSSKPAPVLSQRSPHISKTRLGEVELVDYAEMNRIILKGPTDQVREIAEFLLEIDRPIPMVRIEMIVLEINQDRLLSSQLKAGIGKGGDSLAGNTTLLPGLELGLDGQELNQLLGNIPALQPLGVLNKEFYLNLQTQESRGNLKVQMKPVLSTLNGREASLTIGQTQYFLLETTTSNNGAVNNFQQFTQRFERIQANVHLTIRPFVSDDGMVTLDVLPDFTTPVGSFDAEVPPTISTRRFVSTIRVKDGETVVLGGLSEEGMGENTRGLPWVSRLPVLKWMFGNVQKTRKRSSLLIYITPIVSYY